MSDQEDAARWRALVKLADEHLRQTQKITWKHLPMNEFRAYHDPRMPTNNRIMFARICGRHEVSLREAEWLQGVVEKYQEWHLPKPEKKDVAVKRENPRGKKKR